MARNNLSGLFDDKQTGLLGVLASSPQTDLRDQIFTNILGTALTPQANPEDEFKSLIIEKLIADGDFVTAQELISGTKSIQEVASNISPASNEQQAYIEEKRGVTQGQQSITDALLGSDYGISAEEFASLPDNTRKELGSEYTQRQSDSKLDLLDMILQREKGIGSSVGEKIISGLPIVGSVYTAEKTKQQEEERQKGLLTQLLQDYGL